MHLDRLPHWLQVVLGTMGGAGIFLVAFLDSSVLTFPVINDLLVVNYSILYPARMPYYAAMATLGSTLGCVLLYFLAKKGGEALLRKRAGEGAPAIRAWLERNGFLTILIAAILPPPTPFKFVVIGAGVFRVPFRSFVLAIVISRVVRYFGEGYLGMRYGEQALHYLMAHKAESTLITLAAVLTVYLLTRVLLRYLRRAA